MNLGVLAQIAGSPPPIGELRRCLERTLGAIPELRSGLNEPGEQPTWIPAPGVRLADHVLEWIVPAHQAVPHCLHEVIDEILALRFTRPGPLWECWLIHGFATGHWALLWKAHHVLLDGTSMIGIVRRSLQASQATLRNDRRRWAPQGFTSRRAALTTIGRGGLQYLSGFLPMARALGRQRAGAGRRIGWATVDLRHLRQIAHRHGATVNDVVLATITGALREWSHQPLGSAPGKRWAVIPINTRSAADAGRLGNWVANMRVPLPYDEPDPGRRVVAIAAATTAAKQSSRSHVVWAALQALPAWFARTFFRLTLSCRHADVLISNWGSTESLTYCGKPVEYLVPLMFIPKGHPLAIGITSHGQETCIGLALDESCTGVDELCQLWLTGVEQLASLTNDD